MTIISTFKVRLRVQSSNFSQSNLFMIGLVFSILVLKSSHFDFSHSHPKNTLTATRPQLQLGGNGS